jgi:hypothetical protein
MQNNTANKCIDCQTEELDFDKVRCEACQEIQDFEEREEQIKRHWEEYNESGGRVERDTRNSDYMAACAVR